MRSLLLVVPAAIGAVASLVVLHAAGRAESEGRLEAARRLARRAGFGSAVSSLPLALGTGLAGSVVFGLLFLSSGAVALLAGLAGKPRPSVWLASGLFVAGALGALFAS